MSSYLKYLVSGPNFQDIHASFLHPSGLVYVMAWSSMWALARPGVLVLYELGAMSDHNLGEGKGGKKGLFQ